MRSMAGGISTKINSRVNVKRSQIGPRFAMRSWAGDQKTLRKQKKSNSKG